jgi:hypothetical protein
VGLIDVKGVRGGSDILYQDSIALEYCHAIDEDARVGNEHDLSLTEGQTADNRYRA